MILPLFPEEQLRVQRIDKNTLFALKKIFINTVVKGSGVSDANYLAARSIALDIISDIFHYLETLPSDTPRKEGIANVV